MGFLQLENDDYLLLENGDKILLEEGVTAAVMQLINSGLIDGVIVNGGLVS